MKAPRKYLLLFCCFAISLITYLAPCKSFGQNKYKLLINIINKDTLLSDKETERQIGLLGLQTNFANQQQCVDYIYKLPQNLAAKGFPASSVDSVVYNISGAQIFLYTGNQYKWAEIKTLSSDKKLLEETGWNEKLFTNKRINFTQFQLQQQKILNYFERSGYPFALVKLDSIQIEEDKITGTLKIEKGPLYYIDSIRVYGKTKIKNIFLQKYLGIPHSSIYDKDKLNNISKRLAELPYLQEQQTWTLSMLGTGSVLNLYLQPKRSSQVNFLVGFLPSNSVTGKTQITGDVNLNLKNTFNSGEAILVNWQQLQLKSPRLNLGFNQPYIFHSSFGFDFSFNLLKKDSSYLQLNTLVGIQYTLSTNQSGKIFFQNEKSYLLSGGYDTDQIRITKILPQNIDVSANSIGVDYEWANTNYRYNPRSGNELRVIATAGLKNISKNNDIINLKDPANPGFQFNSLYDSLKLKTYQVRAVFNGAHYFTSGKKSVVKAAVNAGLFQSQNSFRNELFQIGGYKLLRGFDEESIYASQYGVGTVEYRNIVNTNSYLFLFSDVGFTKTKYQSFNSTNNFISIGLGAVFETKAGVLNISYAVGKRNDIKFDIRNSSKIHFGYINYF